MRPEKTILQRLGGPAKVASEYGFTVQQVCNWGVRGIPAAVILDHPDFAKRLCEAGYKRTAPEKKAA